MTDASQPITREAFELWVADAFNETKPPSLRKISKIGEVSKSTLSYQLTNDSIDPKNIITISRGLNLEPRIELAKFPGYRVFANQPQKVDNEQMLCFVSHRDIYAEAGRRLHLPIEAKELDHLKVETIWNAWFKVAAPDASYAKLRELTGLSNSMVGRNQQTGNWNIEQLLNIADHFCLSPHLTLVASGILSLTEGGYSPTARENALAEATPQELQNRLEKITQSLADDIKAIDESELTHAIVEHLA